MAAFTFANPGEGPRPLQVVLDDNYPPYIFRDPDGHLQGILVDQWHLWEQATGRSVQLVAMDWGKALESFRQGRGDVIDTIFQTPNRAKIYSFGKPYAEIPVSIFYHTTISGLPDAHSLGGFAVAVKKGDACIQVLRNNGVRTFVKYLSYEAIIRAAAAGKVKIFCIDDPPAYYFLSKYGLTDRFKRGFSLYSGWFHRAVRKGDEAVLEEVERGFASLDPQSLEAIDRKWMGTPLQAPIPWRRFLWAAGLLAVLMGLGALWIVLLKVRVRQKTRQIRSLLDESRKREEVLRITFQSMAEGVILTDPKGLVERMNPTAESLTGWKEEEARGLPAAEVFQVVGEKTRTPIPDPVALALEKRAPVRLADDSLLIPLEGSKRPVADSASPIVDSQGRLLGCVLVFRDQSEERRTLNLLYEALGKYELAFQAASMSSWEWRIPERRVVRDAQWAQRRGLDPSRRWEDPAAWSETLHPEDRPEVLKGLRNHLKGETSYFEATYRIRSADGSCTWVLDRGKVIERDDEGNPVRMIGIEMDLTAQKTMEARLRLLTQAVEQSPLSIVITDPSAHIEYVNEQFCRLTGYGIREVIGQNPRFLQSGKTPKETYEELWKTITQGKTWSGVFCNRKKDGTLFWEQAVICPILDDKGRISHYVGMKEDITAKKQLEDQLIQVQKLESVGRLAGGVAHDFNNALQVITGYAEVALGCLNPHDRVHRMITEIHKAARRSAGIVRQLLAFARKDIIRPVPLNLNDHLGETHRMLQRLIGEEIVLDLQPDKDLWTVSLDPSQVDQILANLVINARDAIEHTGTITISTQNVELDGTLKVGPVFVPAGQYVRLSVEDTGHGMDEKTLERIFEPFFTTKEVGQGTGLGLSTVYGIVKQHGGWIDVASHPGRGTRFDLYFPRVRTDAEPKAEPARPSAEEKAEGAGQTVLIVEDEPLILELARSILEDAGYRVHAFTSPRAALDWVQTNSDPVHLLLTDVVMPDMSGRELWERLKNLRPAALCLYMSGYTAEMLQRRGLGSDDIQLISKPFSNESLLKRIQDLLGSSEPHLAAAARKP
ncbi:PAS domain S-box protein [Desulfacinum hydrothermale]|uniref:PAS domain S-box protein n=1 Tax=Desulfacinum hydrothermale TaxID=109258 RepID=UPI001481D4B2|nr:PAS domain S-box protein [Desulfacinum hydrothermale]